MISSVTHIYPVSILEIEILPKIVKERTIEYAVVMRNLIW